MINRTPMTGRTLLDTGATSGIGWPRARRSAQIAIADRDFRRTEARKR